LIHGLWTGIHDFIFGTVEPFFTGLAETVKGWIGNAINWLKNIGRDIIQGMWNGITEIWGKMTSWISDAASHLPGFIKGPLGVNSPSKVMIPLGSSIPEGLMVGMEKMKQPLADTTASLADTMLDAFVLDDGIANAVNEALAGIDFNPVVTPVIDLTNVRAGASAIGGLLGANSYLQAGAIANSQQYTEDSIVGAGPTEIKFEQTINAPTQLSTADIYRQTRNQITMAKEELSIA
jgi:hypothetical protein